MSAASKPIRILALAALLALGVNLTGCTSYSGDEGAERTQEQSEMLRDRISTTQIDR